MATEHGKFALFREFVESLPPSKWLQDSGAVMLDELSPELKELLDEQDPFLLYAVCGLIKPNHRTEGLVFTIKKIGQNFVSQSGSQLVKDNILEIGKAAECVVRVLMEQGIIVCKKDSERQWPVGINAQLKFVADEMKKANFYNILAQFGEKAGAGQNEISWHLSVSKAIRDAFVPVDDIGLR